MPLVKTLRTGVATKVALVIWRPGASVAAWQSSLTPPNSEPAGSGAPYPEIDRSYHDESSVRPGEARGVAVRVPLEPAADRRVLADGVAVGVHVHAVEVGVVLGGHGDVEDPRGGTGGLERDRARDGVLVDDDARTGRDVVRPGGTSEKSPAHPQFDPLWHADATCGFSSAHLWVLVFRPPTGIRENTQLGARKPTVRHASRE